MPPLRDRHLLLPLPLVIATRKERIDRSGPSDWSVLFIVHGGELYQEGRRKLLPCGGGGGGGGMDKKEWFAVIVLVVNVMFARVVVGGGGR